MTDHTDNVAPEGAAQAPSETPAVPKKAKRIFPSIITGIPMAGLRKRRKTLWANLLVFTLMGIVFACWWGYTSKHGKHVKVTFQDIHGLHVGSPVELDGDQIGEVVKIDRAHDLARRTLVIELIGESSVADLICRKSTSFSVSRFDSEHLQFKGVTKIVRGPSVVVTLGDPKAAFADELTGSEAMPPDPKISWNSIRKPAFFSHVRGLKAGAPIRYRGVDVGVVESVEPAPGTNYIKVDLAYFETDPKECALIGKHTRLYINMAEISVRGVEGDIGTAIYGAYVDVVPDPYYSNDEPAEKFFGSSDPTPQCFPRIGEKQIVLDSERWLESDAPVYHHGELAGYVLSVRASKEKKDKYDVILRVYPEFQEKIFQESVFFVQPKFKIQAFKSNSLLRGDIEGPKIEITDPRLLLRGALEFTNPPEAKKPFAFKSPERASFVLLQEPPK